MEGIINTIIEWFKGWPEEIVVFFISMLPVLELRGGLIAAAIYKMDWLIAFPICILGNIAPIPFILFFYNKVMDWLKGTKLLGKLARKLEERVKRKSAKIDGAKFLGLLIFVGIPLPGTGGWTGAMAAALLNMRVKKSTPPIILGIILAGTIMSVLTYFIPGLFGISF